MVRRWKRNGLILGFLTLFLAACSGAGTSTNERARDLTPKQLAEEQWAMCSGNFKSVELVEITDKGRIFYRERDASTPTTAYQRCIAFVAYRQVFAGERPGTDVVRRAYFSKEDQPGGSLSALRRNTPPRESVFQTGDDIYFYYFLEALEVRSEVKVIWFNENGIRSIRNSNMGPTGSRYLGTSNTNRFHMRSNEVHGLWGVRLEIEGRDAGEYIFNVE